LRSAIKAVTIAPVRAYQRRLPCKASRWIKYIWPSRRIVPFMPMEPASGRFLWRQMCQWIQEICRGDLEITNWMLYRVSSAWIEIFRNNSLLRNQELFRNKCEFRKEKVQ
jgi:hypothetical protein